MTQTPMGKEQLVLRHSGSSFALRTGFPQEHALWGAWKNGCETLIDVHCHPMSLFMIFSLGLLLVWSSGSFQPDKPQIHQHLERPPQGMGDRGLEWTLDKLYKARGKKSVLESNHY